MSKKTESVKVTSAIVMGGRVVRAGSVLDGIPRRDAKDLARRGKCTILNETVDGEDPETEVPELSEMTVSELKGIADEYAVEGAANMKKAELIKAIEAAEAEAE